MPAFKRAVASLLLCASSPCFAQARLDTTTMSCKSAASLVSTHGAILLHSGPLIYDRYVTDAGLCIGGANEYIAKPAFVPTTDKSQCFIGYFCFPRIQDGPSR